MTRTLTRLIALVCSLSLCLIPLHARADSEEGAYMLTVTLDSLSGTADGADISLPFALQFSAGADLDSLRAFAMIALNAGSGNAAVMGSVEQGEIRASLSGMDTGIVMPFDDAVKSFISQYLLGGLNYDSVSPQLQTAASDYLRLLYESALTAEEAVSSDNPLDALYPPDSWADEHETYPSLLNAEYIGEEEITLFGAKYTASKYAYSIEYATAEEYDAFFAAYNDYYAVDDALDEAYLQMEDLLYEEWNRLYPEDAPEVRTDDGSLSEWEGGSLSEWSSDPSDDTFYSLDGTIWQVDEIMGTLDECTLTIHFPYGDSTDQSVYSDMRTDTCVRIETSSESADTEWPDWRASAADSTVIRLTETGGLTMDFVTLSSESDEDYSFSYDQKAHFDISDTRLTADVEAVTHLGGSYYAGTPYASPEAFALHADLTFSPDEADARFGSIGGTIGLSASASGSDLDVSAGVTMQLSPFPPGELLPAPEKSINPLDADAETLNAFISEVQTRLIQLVGSLMPAPKSPPSVGGALLG